MSQLSLVIQTSFLGDTVLTTPLLRELATRGPVDVVVTPAAATLLTGHPAIRDLLIFDKHGRDTGWSGSYRFARSLRTRADGTPRGTTHAYLAQGSIRSASVAMMAGIPHRIGFDTSAGRLLYTREVSYRREQHHAERLWRLAGSEAETVDPDLIRPRLYPRAQDEGAVEVLLEGAGLSATPFIALAPGSIWGTKRWPHFPLLAARLVSHWPIVVLGGRDDTPIARAIREGAKHGQVVDATGQLSLLASAALLSRAAALVTNDSAPLHLASAMGTPTVAIFGPTIPGFGFGPLAPRRAIVEQQGLPCRPCDAHGPKVCPLGHWRCMRDLAAAHIEEALRPLLPSSPSR